MKKKLSFLFFIILTLGLNAQDAPLGEAEKNAIKATNPFSSVYPTSILKSSDDYFKAQMGLYKEGVIPEKEAHLVGIATSAAIKCQYCIPYHIAELKRLGATEEEIKTMTDKVKEIHQEIKILKQTPIIDLWKADIN